MTRVRDPLLVGVSGPDRIATTSLISGMVPLLRKSGIEVVCSDCSGCLICRRFPGCAKHPWRSDPTEAGRPRIGALTGVTSRFGTLLDAVHARLDAAEIRARTGMARLRANVRSRGRRPAVVLTERGPLDALARFDPPDGSRRDALFRRLADSYDVTLALAPAHGASTETRSEGAPDLEDSYNCQERYRRWSRLLAGTVALTAAPNTPFPPETAVQCLHDRAAALRPRPEPASVRQHVVISIFDDASNSNYRGGGAVVIEKVARGLSDEFDVTILTAGRRSGTSIRDGLRYRYLPVCWAGPRAGQLLFQAALPFMARRIPHAAWLESFTPPFTTSFLPLFTKAPVVGINQCRGGESTWRKYHIPTFIVEHFGLRFYRDLVVLNESDAAEAKRYSPRARVHLIENGVEQQLVDESQFGKGTSIVCLGRVDVRMKGLELLVRAYEKAAPSMPLLLLGHGTPTEERKLSALLTHSRQDNIRWLGYTAEDTKRQLLADSAFMVMPSRHETFGLVALESMSYGKPVLHFELPWLRWMAGKGNVGVPPFDVDRLAKELKRLSEDEQLRRDLGRQAYLSAQDYTWEKMADRYRNLVRLILTPTTLSEAGR